VLVYLGYLATVLFFFLRAGQPAKAPAAPSAPAQTAERSSL
jgi:hypothetical protein